MNGSPDRDDARLEAMLRETNSPLPDAGFSLRVLQALPARETAAAGAVTSALPGPFPRFILCRIAAAIGTIVALATSGFGAAWSANWHDVQIAFAPVIAQFSEPLVLTSLAVAAASTIYAFRWNPLRRALG